MRKGSRKPTPKINPRKASSAFVKAVKVKLEPVVVYQKEKKVLKAIKNKCLWCSGDSYNEAKLCPNTTCLLWPFRLGKNPYTTRGKNLTDEQKAKIVARFKKAREEEKPVLKRRTVKVVLRRRDSNADA